MRLQSIFWGLKVVDLVKDLSVLGGLTTSTTPTVSIEDALLAFLLLVTSLGRS